MFLLYQHLIYVSNTKPSRGSCALSGRRKRNIFAVAFQREELFCQCRKEVTNFGLGKSICLPISYDNLSPTGVPHLTHGEQLIKRTYLYLTGSELIPLCTVIKEDVIYIPFAATYVLWEWAFEDAPELSNGSFIDINDFPGKCSLN